jgi:hypothetical protein
MADDKQRSGPDLDLAEKKWQIRSTQVALLVTLAGLLAGGFKYLDQRHDALEAAKQKDKIQGDNARIQAETARRESRKPFLQKQLSTCLEIVGVVGSLAAENEPGVRVNPVDHAKALDQFWVHYHGALSLVEDDKVEAAMVHLGDDLRQCERDHKKCNLQTNANHLAHACRDVVFNSWDVTTTIHYNQ